MKTYTDEHGNFFELKPYPYTKGDKACVGCDFKFGNSNACRKAPTCTPKGLRGRHVWVNLWSNYNI